MSVHRPFAPRLLNPRHKWGRLAVLLLPVALMGVWLKFARTGAYFPDADLGEVAARVWSDVAFGSAWVLLWGVLCAVGPGWLRTISFYLAHAATLVLGIFLVVSHSYVMTTGNPLTWMQIEYAWRGGGELHGLLQSQITPGMIALFVGVLVSTLVAPVLLGPVVSRALRRPSRLVRRLVVAAVAALLLAASAWSAPTVSAAFALAPPVQLVVAPIREADAYPDAASAAAAAQAVGDTRLVRRSEASGRNLVVITLESQRATSTLPPTSQPVTPGLDALAENSLTPSRGYSLLPHTSKALTAVHCGVAAPPDHDNTEAEAGSMPMPCLAELLGDQGYKTAFLQSATEHFERRRGTVDNLGFDFFRSVDTMPKAGFGKANYFGYEDDIMLGPARDWLATTGGEPFMLGMLTVTGHHDYVLEGHEPIDFVEDPLLNSYLNGIHYQDAFVGRVIDMFKELGLYEDTVFVVTGDHGEGFGEHRVFQHDNTIYDEGVRIPFLVHDPQRAGEHLGQPANQLAVLPTAVDALGFDLVSGHAYQPSLYSGEPQGPLVATCLARGRCTAVIDGDRKLIHHFGDRRDEVFDLAADPFELTDLAATADEVWMGELRDVALAWYVDTEALYAAHRAGE